MVLIYHTAEAELSNVVLGTGSSSVVLFIDPRLRSRNLFTGLGQRRAALLWFSTL